MRATPQPGSCSPTLHQMLDPDPDVGEDAFSKTGLSQNLVAGIPGVSKVETRSVCTKPSTVTLFTGTVHFPSSHGVYDWD